jgi:hypothetical protein
VDAVSARAAAALCAALCLAAGAAPAQPRSAEPEDIKAAFVYHFGKFVEWPPEALSARPHAALCVLGDDRFADTLAETLVGKTLHDRPVQVRAVHGEDDLADCTVLYFAAGTEDRFQLVREQVISRGTLTVGDSPAFARAGAVISFVVVDNKMRFIINAAAADRAGLKVSSQLLKLAVEVTGMPEEPR